MPLNVLVVESNPLRQRIWSQAVKKAGHRVTSVLNSWQAIESFYEYRYDVVFTTVDLPDMDGESFIRRLRDIESHSVTDDFPVFIVAIVSVDTERSTLKEAGASEVLTSPVAIEPALEVLTDWVVLHDVQVEWVLV